MNTEELYQVLSRHGEWLRGKGGKRADLRGTDLRKADLRGTDLQEADMRGAKLFGADIRWCIGNGKEVRSLQVGPYAITYTKDAMAIGCMQQTLREWRALKQSEIDNEGDSALFEKHMPWVLETIERFPAD